MWPWGHVAFGYLWYSLAAHVGWRRRPSDAPTVVATVAALLPDLVDKPLAWTLGITAGGYGPAHSIFVGVPAVLAVGVALAWRGRAEYGVALAAGYVSHLVGDLLFHYVGEGRLVPAVVLWPVVRSRASRTSGLLDHAVYFLTTYVREILAGHASGYVLLSLVLGVAVAALWVADGCPGPGVVTARLPSVNSRDS